MEKLAQLIKSFTDVAVNFFEKMLGFKHSPRGYVHQFYKILKLALFKIILRLFGHVKSYNPPAIIGYFFEPFFIVILITTMKI